MLLSKAAIAGACVALFAGFALLLERDLTTHDFITLPPHFPKHSDTRMTFSCIRKDDCVNTSAVLGHCNTCSISQKRCEQGSEELKTAVSYAANGAAQAYAPHYGWPCCVPCVSPQPKLRATDLTPQTIRVQGVSQTGCHQHTRCNHAPNTLAHLQGQPFWGCRKVVMMTAYLER